MFQLLEGVVPYSERDSQTYLEHGWWRGWTLGDYFDRAADIHPAKEGVTSGARVIGSPASFPSPTPPHSPDTTLRPGLPQDLCYK